MKYHWMRKHGAENISIRVLETGVFESWDYVSYAERYWIGEMEAFGHDLLNQTPGGKGGRGSKHTEETRAKMRAVRRKRGPEHHLYGKKQDPEVVQRRIAKSAASRWTPEARAAHSAKMSANNPGSSLPGELNPFFGKNHSDETKARMAESAKNRPPISDETRLKLQLRNHNRWHTNRGITKPDCPHC